jgi:hypothetical protein
MKLVKTALLAATVLALTAGSVWAEDKTTTKHEQDKADITNATRSDKSSFAKLDTNKSGYISRREARADEALSRDFDKFDLNKDGKLNRTEYLAARGKEDTVTVGKKISNKVKSGKDDGTSTTEGNDKK